MYLCYVGNTYLLDLQDIPSTELVSHLFIAAFFSAETFEDGKLKIKNIGGDTAEIRNLSDQELQDLSGAHAAAGTDDDMDNGINRLLAAAAAAAAANNGGVISVNPDSLNNATSLSSALVAAMAAATPLAATLTTAKTNAKTNNGSTSYS
jgi:hypothetical protein